MFCPKCGTAMSDDASFCPSCGTAAAANAVAAPPALPGNVLPGAPPAAAPQVVFALQTEDKAVISMVLGILSLLGFLILAGIPAIILGKMSRNKIRASGGRLSGDGMALAGIILGWISVGLAVLVVLFFVFMILYLIPNR